MPSKKIFLESEIEEIIVLYQNDIPIPIIAARYRIDAGPIQRLLKEKGIFKPAYLTKVSYTSAMMLMNKEHFVQKYQEFKDYKLMAAYYKCGRDLIISMCKRYEISSYGTHGKQTVHLEELKQSELSYANLYKMYVVEHTSFGALIKRFKIAKPILTALLIEYNIPIRSAARSLLTPMADVVFNDKNALMKLRSSFYSVKEMAAHLGCAVATLRSVLKSHNIQAFTLSEQKHAKSLESIVPAFPNYSVMFEAYADVILFKHIPCGYEFERSRCSVSLCMREGNQQFWCPRCFRRKSTSIPEQQVYEYVQSIIPSVQIQQNISIRISNLARRSLDIYIPSLKLAIEYGGLYFHSEEMGKYKLYHKEKLDYCRNNGIRLLTIFEDEWLLKKEIVKSKLRHILGHRVERVYARKCVVRNISAPDKNKFLDCYHLQGADHASIKIGIFYDANLVGVCTFAKPNIAKGGRRSATKVELNRYATSVHVVGGLGKCLKFLKENYRDISEIFTFADLRWSEGNLYKQLGFIEVQETPPNYWYVPPKAIKRYHRYNFRKSVLPSKFKNVDMTKTEIEIMRENKYRRIWDCGSKKFLYYNKIVD